MASGYTTGGGGGSSGGGLGGGGLGVDFSEIFTGESTKDPWDGWKNVGKILGITGWSRAKWLSLTDGERSILSRAARDSWLRRAVLALPKFVKDNRAAFQQSGGNTKVAELWHDWKKEGKPLPVPDLAAVARVLARLAGVAPEIQVPSDAGGARAATQPKPETRAQSQQPKTTKPPDASTAGEIGATVRTIYQTARDYKEQLAAFNRQRKRAADAAQGAPPVSLADTLNTVLGTAAQAYGSYTSQKIAEAQAKAARTLSGYSNGYSPALYSPEPEVTAAGIPPAALQAIQRFLSQGGAAALGAGAGGLAATLLPSPAPMVGGGGAMILRPGDSVDSLYAQRTASAAPSFFATQDASGRLKWYRSAGRPILWSGDLAAARRVSRVAARASRGRGRPRFLRRKRR